MVITKKIDFLFIRFPIILPIFYGFFIYSFPSYENLIIFFTLMLLAEPHFGATLPFFLYSKNFPKILTEKIKFIIIPILIIFFTVFGYFYFYQFFLLIFLGANFYHVTRQSYGVCKLYNKNIDETNVQEFFIYLFNIIFFIVALLRFGLGYFENNLLYLNIVILLLIFFMSVWYAKKFNFTKNYFTMITGILIFYPICFVDKPIHAIIMGVTMHYSQYLILTHKITLKRKNIYQKYNFNFLIFIFVYGLLMALASSSAFVLETSVLFLNEKLFKNLILIPLIGQMLHFYIDSNLWKFSDKHHRDVTLKHIVS